MKERFNRNELTKACCGENTSNTPKKELIAREKHELKSNKIILKKTKIYMNTLRKMSGDYDYNQNHLAELVGGVYMRMDAIKGYIDHNKNRIKSLKGKKDEK